MQEYEQVFKILQEQDQTDNISDIVQSFVEIEDRQSSLLNFINTQNDEVRFSIRSTVWKRKKKKHLKKLKKYVNWSKIILTILKT